MLDFTTALHCILEHTTVLPPQQKYFTETQGNVLAENIFTSEPIPRFDFSAVDGFAVRSSEITSLQAKLKLQGTIRAGDAEQLLLKKNHALKILTGAPVPNNADAIVMNEDCEENSSDVIIHKKITQGENIRKQIGRAHV